MSLTSSASNMTSMSELRGWQWFMQTSFPMAVAVLSDEEMKPPNHTRIFNSYWSFSKS